MKQFGYLLFFIVTLVSFTACQKEITADPSNANNLTTTDFKVKTYTQVVTSATLGNSAETYNLTYDGNGRILSVIDVADTANKFMYNYGSGNTYTLDIFNSGMLSVHETFFLNGLPLIDSTSQYNDAGDTTLEKSIYNSAGNLIQLKDYDYTTAGGPQLTDVTDYTYDPNGNITQQTESSGNIETYEYLADLNTINVGTVYQTQNKNLTKKTIIADGGSVITINHSYTFDSVNRITSERQEYSTGDIVVNSYTYF